MGNIYELMAAASSCESFSSEEENLMNSTGTSLSKNCSKCIHYKNRKCNLDLYDKVVSSLND